MTHREKKKEMGKGWESLAARSGSAVMERTASS